jgi:Ca2+-binding EF-hand superfamily protein
MTIKYKAFIAQLAYTVMASAFAEDANKLSKFMGLSDATIEEKVTERFGKADVNRDGDLTMDEAKNGMPRVAKNFSAIDSTGKGYVSLSQILAFALQKKADYKAGKLK